MRILGIDYGEKRVGVSISDPLEIVAKPLTVIHHYNDDSHVVTLLSKIINENKVETIVIGLPYNMNGSLGFQGERVIEFTELLKSELNVTVLFEDERETSKQVKELLKTLKIKTDIIDDRAAAIILQNYLDYKS